jgi:hypothetical protein
MENYRLSCTAWHCGGVVFVGLYLHSAYFSDGSVSNSTGYWRASHAVLTADLQNMSGLFSVFLFANYASWQVGILFFYSIRAF